MKKIVALILSGILCLSLLSACGGQSKTGSHSDLNQPDEDDLEMEGYDFVILQHEESDAVGYSLKAENPFGYPQGTSFADEVLERIKKIEETTGCKVTLKSTAADYGDLAKTISMGNREGDLLFSASVQVVQQFARSGALLPLDEFDVVDFSQTDKYGTANIVEVSSYNGHPYAVSPLLWPLRQARVISVFMIDTELTSSYGLTDPHEYLEKKNWSWNGVEELMQTYYINEGDRELKALDTRSLDFMKLAVFGNGVDLIRKDDDGNYVPNVGDNNMIEAIEWTTKIYSTYKDAFVDPGSPAWETVTNAFVSRESIAALIPTSIIYNTMIYHVKQFSIVPFPNGPHGVYGEWPGVLEAADTLGILSSTDEEDFDAEILVRLTEPFDSIPDYSSLVDYYADNVFFSREDAEIILGIAKNAQYSYWPFSGADNYFWNNFTSAIYNGDSVTKMQSHIKAFSTFIEDNIIPNRPIYDLVG